MVVLTELAAWNLMVFFAVLVVVQLASKEGGYVVGAWMRKHPNAKDESIGIVSTSIYGLLAFALAFNLSLATSRYGDRRAAVLQEANAIGTLWLQATALDHPRAAEIARMTEDYIALRESAVRADWGSPEIADAAAALSALQGVMWGHLTGILRDRVDPQVVQLTASMNAVFDASTVTQVAVNRTGPNEVLWLLMGLTVLTMGLMGYQFGLNGHPHRLLGLTAVLVWTSVLFVILDLGAARIGDIRVDTSVFDATMSGMKPIPIPPLP